MAVRNQDALAWLAALQQVYSENRQWLTDLDAAIGDADHGSNMDRGFAAVKAELAAKGPADLRSTFQMAAAVLIRTVGGASGPLYGTFFLRAGAACEGTAELDAAGVAAMFAAGVAGIQQRGKAAAGDKTMLDALCPALEAMRKSVDEGRGLAEMLDAGVRAAEAGMQATIPMQARKGRASYLGARSIGHQDPGATSAWLLLRTAAAAWSAGGA